MVIQFFLEAPKIATTFRGFIHVRNVTRLRKVDYQKEHSPIHYAILEDKRKPLHLELPKEVPDAVEIPAGICTAVIPRTNKFMVPITMPIRNLKTFEETPETVRLSAFVFNSPIRTDVIHQVVVWHQAAQRAGSASTKHRSDVAGSTRKIYQQKGSGRARAGSVRACHRRGGYTCFGPKPRDFSTKLQKKVQRMGLRSAFAIKLKYKLLCIIKGDALNIPTHKTKAFKELMDKISSKKILILDDQDPPRNLETGIRGISEQVKFMNIRTAGVNAYHVMDSRVLLIADRALPYIEERLGYKAEINYDI